MQDYIGQFQAHWQDFMARLAGQMSRRARGQLPPFSQLQLILQDAASDWASRDNRWGRWLMALEQQDARKAALIRDIFLQDMRFQKMDAPRGMPPCLQAVIPAAGALAGLGISLLCHAPAWAVAVSSAGPGLALFPAAKAAGECREKQALQNGIRQYLSQLDKYYQSILSILQS